MKKIDIKMPAGVRYMSEARDYLLQQLPSSGKYILDKSLTGCGGTELFLTSGRPLVLISPRSGMLFNKAAQHPEAHLFRDSKKKDLKELKQDLKNYLLSHVYIPGFRTQPPIILTTLDSAKYIIEELEFQSTIDNFIFLTDEFQNLIGDAAFKGKTDLEFLKMIDRCAKNICYMSATPIQDTYLNALPEFQNLEYYKLNWDPNIIVEPTVNDILMKKGENAVKIFSEIIARFRQEGYFAKKLIGGHEYRATEAVVFVNEVKTIEKIIKQNNLKPYETSILISESADACSRLKTQGFTIGGNNPDRNNPINKTFTFCSKASFEGCDFYSTCAFTYIFLDGTKNCLTHDTAIEIPQMLGRQRLDINPFKYNATIYYKTNPKVESKNEFFIRTKERLQSSESILKAYETGDSNLQKALAQAVVNKNPQDPYVSNYLDVIHDTSGYRLEINYLVVAAEHNLWANKAFFYNNPLHLTTAIQTQLATAGTKPQELRDFEDKFYVAPTDNDRMRIYATFRNTYPHYQEVLYQNPFIAFEYHEAYNTIGPQILAQMGYDMNQIRLNFQKQNIINLCKDRFTSGMEYRAKEVKTILQEIYDKVGLSRTATASQLHEYIQVTTRNKKQPDGSRQEMYIII